VVETLLREPDLFDTYIAIDPSLWWNDQKLVVEAGEHLRSRPHLKTQLFLGSSGEERIPGVFQRFADVLQKNAPPGLRWHAVTLPEENTRRFITRWRSKRFGKSSNRPGGSLSGGRG
jgi:hypothetical protein